MKFLIYKAISPNGKIYIGQTKNLTKRIYSHKNNNSVFSNALKKYGIDNFEWQILNENLTKQQANMWERLWIFVEKSNNREFGYNMTEGGENPPINNKPLSEETKQKISMTLKGHRVSDETKLKMRKKRDVSFGKKLSLAKKGIPNLKIRGKIISERQKQIISESNKRRNTPRDSSGRFIKS